MSHSPVIQDQNAESPDMEKDGSQMKTQRASRTGIVSWTQDSTQGLTAHRDVKTLKKAGTPVEVEYLWGLQCRV